VLQLPLSTFLYGDLRPIVGTPVGTAWVAMTLAFVLVIALIFFSWLTERPSLLWPAFAIAVAFASGYSLSGHSAAEPNASRWSQLADWAHLTAASLWAGGLVMLLVLCLSARELSRRAFADFARFAPVLIALLVAAGGYLSFLRLPEPAALWTTSYGQVLMVKLGLVALALTWGAVHHFVVEPRLDRPGVVARLPRSLAGEAAVGMAVLLVAAILVNTAPPRSRPSPATTPAAASPASPSPDAAGRQDAARSALGSTGHVQPSGLSLASLASGVRGTRGFPSSSAYADAINLNAVPVGSAACASRPYGVSSAGCVTLPPSSTIRSRAASVSSTPK
jgi:putative copper export protein